MILSLSAIKPSFWIPYFKCVPWKAPRGVTFLSPCKSFPSIANWFQWWRLGWSSRERGAEKIFKRHSSQLSIRFLRIPATARTGTKQLTVSLKSPLCFKSLFHLQRTSIDPLPSNCEWAGQGTNFICQALYCSGSKHLPAESTNE